MTGGSRPPASELWQLNSNRSKWIEYAIKIGLGTLTLISVITTIGIIWMLAFESARFFAEIPIWRFFTETQWTPLFVNPKFGIVVLMSATILIVAIALVVAIPLGLLSAIFLSEYAPPRLRRWLKPILEILAGIPTVVYGYFALTFLTPTLQNFVPGLETFNALSAGIAVGIAITPLVASLSEDAIYTVPQSLRQGAYALGATRRETVTGVVLPAALSGIVSACILAMSRAVGETMIVSIAAGQNPQLTFDPRVSIATMTAFIAQVSMGDTPYGSIEYLTLFAVGTMLFLMTLSLNIFSFWFVNRFRETYK
jgi:phosphate transport system permease protein